MITARLNHLDFINQGPLIDLEHKDKRERENAKSHELFFNNDINLIR